MREFPAYVSHEGLPRKPTEVRLANAPLRWRVIEVLNAAQNVVIKERPARKIYHLLVFGPMPYAPERSGEFELIAVDYVDRSYWWIRPEPNEPGDQPGDVSDSVGRASA
ncbi:hypothetical protein AB0C84_42975 [Actinomadura sp. NPDC048955]|uniref:hypothetical protein n=1 Tax=Actinomadura sp. NPDC048955 TaxID=3158228 RepID=UPI0033FDD91F